MEPVYHVAPGPADVKKTDTHTPLLPMRPREPHCPLLTSPLGVDWRLTELSLSICHSNLEAWPEKRPGLKDEGVQG